MRNLFLILFTFTFIVCNGQDEAVLNNLNHIKLDQSETVFKMFLNDYPQSYQVYKSSAKRLVLIPSTIAKEDFNKLSDTNKAIVIDFYTTSNGLKLKTITGDFNCLFYLWKTHFNSRAVKETIKKDYKNQSSKASAYSFKFKKSFNDSWTIQNISL